MSLRSTLWYSPRVLNSATFDDKNATIALTSFSPSFSSSFILCSKTLINLVGSAPRNVTRLSTIDVGSFTSIKLSVSSIISSLMSASSTSSSVIIPVT